MKLNIEYFDSTEELLKGSLSGNSPNSPNGSNSSGVHDLNNLNLLVRADTSDIAADTATDSGGAANNDELLIYQFQRDFFFEKSKELQELKEIQELEKTAVEETAAEEESAEAADIEEQPQPICKFRELYDLHGRGAVILINDNRHTAYVEETDDVANSLASIIGSDEDENEEAEQAEDADEIGLDTVNTVATVGTEDPADPANPADAAETANTSDTVDINTADSAVTAPVGAVSSSDSDGSDADEAEEAANDEDMAGESDEAPTISNFYWNTAIIIVTTSSADTLTADTTPATASSATPTADSVHITRYLVKKIRKISGYRVTHREVYQNYDVLNCDLLDLTAFFILRNVLQTQIVRVARGEDQQNSSVPSIPTSRLFIINQAKGVYATARLLSEKRILVQAGSRISKEDSLVHQKGQEASERLRQGLIEAGVIDRQERTFNADYEFHSTSSAASVILGQSANGLTTWKDAAGHRLAELLGRRDTGYKG